MIEVGPKESKDNLGRNSFVGLVRYFKALMKESNNSLGNKA